MSFSVVVTGASSGIGRSTALLLAEKGFRTFGTVRRADDAQRLAESGVETIRLDVTDSGSVARCARKVTDALNGAPLTALVNNAGVPIGGPIEFVDLTEVRAGLEVNVLGVIAVTQAFLPLLRASRGRIVNISSVSGRVSHPFIGAYSGTKYALEAISDALRRELVPAGVDVVLVEPGSVQTPIWDKIDAIDLTRYRNTSYDGAMQPVKETAVAAGRAGLPRERVAAAVHRAITARRPPVRIPVVKSRLGFFFVRQLPARIVDRLAVRALGCAEA